MTTQPPGLGSTINIITKADIRYEGRLFTVDPEKCTIALSNVRSFGTEDRETVNPVPPQNQVYDYIIFRGRDIKDIGYVNNNTVPNDPAIVQMSAPQSIGTYQPGYSIPPVMAPMTSGLSQFSPYGAMGVLPGLSAPLASGLGLHDPRALTKQSELQKVGHIPDPTTVDDQASVLDLITGSPRSGTPSLLTRKSPTMDQGVQVNQPIIGLKEEKSTLPPQTRAIQPPTRNGRGVNRQQPLVPQGQTQRPAQVFQSLSSRDHLQENQNQNREYVSTRDYSTQRDFGSQNREYSAVLRDQVSLQSGSVPSQVPLPQRAPQQQQRRNQLQIQDQQNHLQQVQQQRSGWNNRIGGAGIRRGRGRGQQSGNYNRAPGSGQQIAGKPRNTLKFENDYDFEQANTEFDKLMSELAKTKITDAVATNATTTTATTTTTTTTTTVTPPEGKSNGEVEKKEDSGNETGVGEGEVDDEQEIFYDKAKSFFDNISCEAIERSKGRSQRTDWRTERKLNSETFGVSAARRGAFRGRGYYGNRMATGGMYRPNYRGGYRAPQIGGLRPGMRTNVGGSLMGPVPVIGQSRYY